MDQRKNETVCNISYLHTPVGWLRITGVKTGICQITLVTNPPNIPTQTTNNPHIKLAVRQLSAYFSKPGQNFTFPMILTGTPFQNKVWRALNSIPFGKTASYSDIALSIGHPKAVRAVGMANKRNPLLIAVPCHRVIKKNGNICGFACGVHVKIWLQDHEKRFAFPAKK